MISISRNRAAAAAVLFVVFAFASLAAVQASAQDHASMAGSAHHTARAADIARDPADVPPPVGNRAATTVKVELTAQEVTGELDPAAGTTYKYWTFNGKVPGPMVRVRQGDKVQVTLHNDAASQMVHSIDFHAAIGPGGGAALSQVMPGQAKTFTFEATTPGLYVYHCGTPMIGDHIANGMYGMILVEPPAGMPPADREYYVMQGEIYTSAPKGKAGLQGFSEAKLLQEAPEYFVFNGTVDALTKRHPLHANTGDTVRIFFGDAGPNATSSFHVVGEIFTHEYVAGSLTSPPMNGVQTATVAAGSAAILELKAATAGQFNFMDHAMARMVKGLMGTITVSGAQNASLMHLGPAEADATATLMGVGPATAPASASLMHAGPATSNAASGAISGMTQADMASGVTADSPIADSNPPVINSEANMDMPAMSMHRPAAKLVRAQRRSPVAAPSSATQSLAGCMSLEPDGKVMLHQLGTNKVFRLEARPLLFQENGFRIVRVTGYYGSVVAVEDPRVPSFVVDTLDALAPNCSAKITPADIRKFAARAAAGQSDGQSTVQMTDMAFQSQTITVNVGQEVVWKNTSSTIHNVVADPAKAMVAADVRVPSGAHTFASQLLQPGQTFSHTFTVPGVYRYVCTLHESNGMKGVVIVKDARATVLAGVTTH